MVYTKAINIPARFLANLEGQDSSWDDGTSRRKVCCVEAGI